MSQALRKLRLFDEAWEHCEKAAEIEPGLPSSVERAWLHLSRGDNEKVCPEISQHKGWDIDSDAAEIFARGAIAIGRPEDAEQRVLLFHRLILAWVHEMRGDRLEALEQFVKSTRRDHRLAIAALTGETAWIQDYETNPWTLELTAFLSGEQSAEELVAAADDSEHEIRRRQQRCEAHFFTGLVALRSSGFDAAKPHLQACVDEKVGWYLETNPAHCLLKTKGKPRPPKKNPTSEEKQGDAEPEDPEWARFRERAKQAVIEARTQQFPEKPLETIERRDLVKLLTKLEKQMRKETWESVFLDWASPPRIGSFVEEYLDPPYAALLADPEAALAWIRKETKTWLAAGVRFPNVEDVLGACAFALDSDVERRTRRRIPPQFELIGGSSRQIARGLKPLIRDARSGKAEIETQKWNGFTLHYVKPRKEIGTHVILMPHAGEWRVFGWRVVTDH